MCVIAFCEDKRPTTDQVQKMWDQNNHGGGVAWREDGHVCWKKGLTLEEMKTLAKELPFPFIMHFRIASIGGQKPALTHPFAIKDFDQSLELEGKTKGGVLFHNGHWGEWFTHLLSTSGHFRKKIPIGAYSDSRAMAWLTSFYGQGFLEALNEKTISLSPNRIDITIGGGWVKVNDIWYSNDYWDKGTTAAWMRTMCKNMSCTNKEDLDTDGYCPRHRKGHTVQVNAGRSSTTQTSPAANNGMGTAVQEVTGGGRQVDPFDPREQLMQAELAWSLYTSGLIPKEEAQACCSKNKLKALRRQVERMGRKLRGKPIPIQLPLPAAN